MLEESKHVFPRRLAKQISIDKKRQKNQSFHKSRTFIIENPQNIKKVTSQLNPIGWQEQKGDGTIVHPAYETCDVGKLARILLIGGNLPISIFRLDRMIWNEFLALPGEGFIGRMKHKQAMMCQINKKQHIPLSKTARKPIMELVKRQDSKDIVREWVRDLSKSHQKLDLSKLEITASKNLY